MCCHVSCELQSLILGFFGGAVGLLFGVASFFQIALWDPLVGLSLRVPSSLQAFTEPVVSGLLLPPIFLCVWCTQAQSVWIELSVRINLLAAAELGKGGHLDCGPARGSRCIDAAHPIHI